MEGTFAPAAFGEPACDAAGRCAYPLSRTGSRVTGSFEGTSVAAGAGIPIGTGFAGTGIQVFTGSVEGCGEGSLVLTESLTSTDGVTSSGTWQIVAGSGTGGLDVRGGGTFIAVQRPDGSGSTTSSGRIRC